jgi:hypothetical protein
MRILWCCIYFFWDCPSTKPFSSFLLPTFPFPFLPSMHVLYVRNVYSSPRSSGVDDKGPLRRKAATAYIAPLGISIIPSPWPAETLRERCINEKRHVSVLDTRKRIRRQITDFAPVTVRRESLVNLSQTKPRGFKHKGSRTDVDEVVGDGGLTHLKFKCSSVRKVYHDRAAADGRTRLNCI